MRYKDLYLSGYVAAVPGAQPETRPSPAPRKRRRRIPHRVLLAMITSFVYPLTRIDSADASTTIEGLS